MSRPGKGPSPPQPLSGQVHPPALTAQTAASQQTSNFNSRPPPSQPPLPVLPPEGCCSAPSLRRNGLGRRGGENPSYSFFLRPTGILLVLVIYMRYKVKPSCFSIYL